MKLNWYNFVWMIMDATVAVYLGLNHHALFHSGFWSGAGFAFAVFYYFIDLKRFLNVSG